ncbi:hypothetical protein J536_1305 [Acinetobacter sp. 809848]|nr:hypothetical protein J536_1305 [Acinetobacter sp. 809848]
MLDKSLNIQSYAAGFYVRNDYKTDDYGATLATEKRDLPAQTEI